MIDLILKSNKEGGQPWVVVKWRSNNLISDSCFDGFLYEIWTPSLYLRRGNSFVVNLAIFSSNLSEIKVSANCSNRELPNPTPHIIKHSAEQVNLFKIFKNILWALCSEHKRNMKTGDQYWWSRLFCSVLSGPKRETKWILQMKIKWK